MKIENVALRVRLVVFTISLLAFVLPAAADTTLTVEVDGSEKTLDAISTSNKSKKYWGAKVSSDNDGVVSSVSTTYTNSKKSSTSTTIKLSGKVGTAEVIVFYSDTSSPKSGTTANTITISAKSPPPPEEVAVAVHETKSFDFKWTADSNAQYWQVIVNRGSANATAKVDNPGDRNTSPQGSKVLSNKITITGVAVGSASFTVQNKSTSNNAWANFKTYNVTVTNPYTVIPTPTAEAGLAYDGESHQGVKAGEHYTLGGAYTAVNAGTYEATVTPKSGYCWEDGSVVAKAIKWTIARRPATVMVVNTNKVAGAVFIDSDQQTYNDPIWTTTTEGLIASDTTELTWDIFRTNACEEVGTYDLLVEGATKQGNYDLTFVGGKYEICEAKAATVEFSVDASSKVNYEVFISGQRYANVPPRIEARAEFSVVARAIEHFTYAGVVAEGWVYDSEDDTLTFTGTAGDSAISLTVPDPVAKVFYVKYYMNSLEGEVVHSNAFTMANYTTELQIWDGKLEGFVFDHFEEEDGTLLTKTDEALRAYITREAEAPGCDGVLKVVGFWTRIPETFDITIAAEPGITNVMMNGMSVLGTLTLPVKTTEIALTLLSTNTIPVYMFSRDGGTTWSVTNRTPVAAVAAGDVLTFRTEEAKVDDPEVTDEQVTAAIIAAIDGEEGEKTHDDAVAKVETITAGEEGGRAVEPKDLATWITDKQISSTSIAQSDYVAASVHFNTSAPITGEAKVEFTEIGEVSSDAFTFAFEVTLDGKETPEELNLVKEFVAGCIETTGDLGEGFAGTVDPNRVTIEDGKVKITPDPTKTAEFFKIVIPKDPIR